MPGLSREPGSHPLHRQLADLLRSEIIAGRLPGGSKLPSERELSESYGVDRTTTRHAVAQLVAEGWVRSEHGRGNIVRTQDPLTPIDLLLEVDEDHRGLFMYRHAADWQLQAPTRIEEEPPSAEVARRLDLAPGSLVVKRDRIVGPQGGPPGQLATTWLPSRLVERVPRIAAVDTGPTGFLGLLEAAGYRLRFTLTVGTRMPIPSEAEALDLDPGVPVLRLLRTTYDATAREALELTDYRLPGDRYEVTTPLRDRRQRAESAEGDDLSD